MTRVVVISVRPRNRVSKMLLRHGVVYPDASTWTARHRAWRSRQQFDETSSELVFIASISMGHDASDQRNSVS